MAETWIDLLTFSQVHPDSPPYGTLRCWASRRRWERRPASDGRTLYRWTTIIDAVAARGQQAAKGQALSGPPWRDAGGGPLGSLDAMLLPVTSPQPDPDLLRQYREGLERTIKTSRRLADLFGALPTDRPVPWSDFEEPMREQAAAMAGTRRLADELQRQGFVL